MGDKPGLKPMLSTQYYTASWERGQDVSLTESTHEAQTRAWGSLTLQHE